MTYATRRRWYTPTRRKVSLWGWAWALFWILGASTVLLCNPFSGVKSVAVLSVFVGGVGFELFGAWSEKLH